jgi:hypothetical protein
VSTESEVVAAAGALVARGDGGVAARRGQHGEAPIDGATRRTMLDLTFAKPPGNRQ